MDETPLAPALGSGSVTVASAAPAPTQPAQPDQPAQPTQPTQPADPNQPTTEPESETPEQVNEDLVVEIDGETWYIVEELNADYLPDGFEATSMNYGEGQTAIEVGKALHADAYLFRVADRDLNHGHFLVWDESSDSFSPLVMINGTHAVIPLTNAAGVPEGFAETEIEVNVTENENGGEAVTNADGEETGETVPAYTADVIQAWKAGNGTDDDFALVHVVNPDGELGFYRYDAREQTLQRYVRETLEAPQEPETEVETAAPAETEPAPAESGLKDKILPIGLGAAAAAFLIATIALAAANAKKKARIAELEGGASAGGPYDDGPYDDGPYDDGPRGGGPFGGGPDGDGPFDEEPETGGPFEDDFFDDAEPMTEEPAADPEPVRTAERAEITYGGYDGNPETVIAPAAEAAEETVRSAETAAEKAAGEAAAAAADAASAKTPEFNLPESRAGAKGFISELEQMEKRLLESEDGGFDE